MSKTKYCPNCYLTKSVEEFNCKKNAKDGLQGYCRTCSQEEFKKHRDNNPKYKEREQAYEKIRAQKIANGEMPHRVEANKIRSKNNYIVKRIIKNVDSTKDKMFFDTFGCSKKVFIQRFEQHFKYKQNRGMTWQNHGAWHMDHRKPLKEFKLDTEANRKLANYYTNLRPIWATANMKKAVKFIQDDV